MSEYLKYCDKMLTSVSEMKTCRLRFDEKCGYPAVGWSNGDDFYFGTTRPWPACAEHADPSITHPLPS